MKEHLVLAALGFALAGCPETATPAACSSNADCDEGRLCVTSACVVLGEGEGEGEGEGALRITASRLTHGSGTSSSSTLRAAHHLTAIGATPMRGGNVVVTTR